MSTPTPHGGPVEFVQFLRLFEQLGDGWVLTAVLGVFAGFIVRFATSSRRSLGLVSTCLFGVVGAFIGVWVAAQFGVDTHGTGMRFLAALGGSVLLALLGGLVGAKDREPD